MNIKSLFNKDTRIENHRQIWVNALSKIIEPVLTNAADETLKANMPVKYVRDERAKFAHLEAVGRTVCGIAPWLELGKDNTSEGKLRAKYIDLTTKALVNICNPDSPDYLIFDEPYQPLVDSAHLAEGLLRAKTQLWDNIDSNGQELIINALKKTRSIDPWNNNWILFPSMIEAFLLETTGEYDEFRLMHGVNIYMNEWYCGDSYYGDGPNFHFDYYNSYVIHPMLTDILTVLRKHNIGEYTFLDAHLHRLRHYAGHLERLISPEGTYPVVGRSMLYRTAAFQALGQACLFGLYNPDVKPEQVRCALTAVIQNQFSANDNFDENGWLRFGFNGNQKKVAEEYSNTGSMYLCTTGFLPLGLAESDRFWSAPDAEWTSLKAWSGKDIDSNMYITD